MAAVVIAAEERAATVVDENPVGKMDRANAAETAAGEDVARGPIDHMKDHELEADPEAAGLDRAHSGILVGDVVILEKAQPCDPGGIIGVLDNRVCQLPPPQRREGENQADDCNGDRHPRDENNESGRDDNRREKVKKVGVTPGDRRRRDRRQRRPAGRPRRAALEHRLRFPRRDLRQGVTQERSQASLLAGLNGSAPTQLT